MATILEDVKRILIIRCGALGDLIYATVMIDAVTKQYGKDVKIDVVATPGPGAILAHDLRVNTIYPLKHRKVPIFLSREKQNIIQASKTLDYDLLINLEENKHFDKLATKINAKHKVGSPFTSPKLKSGQRHMVDIIKQTLAPFCSDAVLDISLPKLFGSSYENVQKQYTLPDKYIVFSPSNSHSNRNKINYRAWPQHHWKKLLSMIPAHIPVVIIGGKGEEAYFAAIKPYPSNVIDLSGKTPLVDLITIIDHAEMILTTDTGPAHLASAVDTDITVLIGPTPVSLTGPYPTPNITINIISQNLPCSPCYNTDVMKNCQDNICMKQITPSAVFKGIQPTLDTF
ncbi:MAG: glycosyltransferase family 9 protein [Sulfurimonadaceae bacterium]